MISGREMKKTAVEQEIVSQFSARVREILGDKLVHIYWFGSRARGEGSEDSDYDILLETARRLTKDERDRVADVAVDISAERGVLLDIHERTSEAVLRKHPFSVFTQTVLEEGIRV